jgi:hypothetical protein
MRHGFYAILSGAVLCVPAAHAAHYSLIVGGLGGEAEYEQRFREQAQSLEAAAKQLGEESQVSVLRGEQATRDATRRALASIAERATVADQLVVTFIGHGSFDGEEYRFNVPGPDITGTDIAAWLQPIAARQQLIVLATSSSGAAVTKLQREHRIVITATKSGGERNATRFAEHWTKALTSSEADRDKNEWVTAQEAYDYATRKVADAFKGNAALATEHARMEGAKAEQLALGRLGNAKAMPTDVELNRLFAERLRIETDFDAVKARKAELKEDSYYVELEKVLVELARTQKRIDARQAALSGTGS